ncbi:urease accessory protein UreF [Blochmannia endosymbiont of Camponotus modoc]|uniref:urease accessory protein UreF n=1 Tax=Blochmannia endosymbiont of Camponotus modoc TaxID=2945587 RepID=UPI0020246145|nr:urease accessory UreF family protein [Blochmannia endosymbiont of Camponotus modoc]URJ29513.1 urease accessory protein UreF [Blochmannia endosymbiont of Camponotus modoc]
MCADHGISSVLSLMQLVSSNFPVGGFAYSQGLEWAVECNWVNSVETFYSWQQQWINGPLIYLEWPMLKRCYYYTQIKDEMSFFQCALRILSYRDTHELRLEEQQRGKALSRIILQWYPFTNGGTWLSALEHSGLASIAWLGYMWSISLENLALGYAYNMLESATMTGLKLVPFGQITAQKLLRSLMERLPNDWKKSDMITDHELGNSFPLQSIASSCHETQYSRLFRS